VGSNYDTDLFRPIIQRIAEISGKAYGPNDVGVAHRVIADHVRALTFAIADGALPANEGRGYVLRRILRRAARFARKLDLHEPVIYKLVPTVVDVMGDAFPEIKEKHQYIASVIKSEEERFNVTLDRGIELFEKLAADMSAQGRTQIPGAEAFRLYDTYGFPLDLTRLMAEEKNLTVDETGFQQEMEQQRERSRAADKFDFELDIHFEEWEKISAGPDSKFLGYEQLDANAIIRLLRRKDDYCYLILDQTPFYGEAGGQVGDQGEIELDGYVLNVENTIRHADHIIHIARGFLPEPLPMNQVKARVKRDQRMSTARNHTATHLLQAALRQVLGKHVQQSGSLVTPFRLRFDLTHFERIAPEQLKQIERIVNEKIRENIPLQIFYSSYDEARKQGAMALFGEKYGDRVRVIKIDDFSMELCGGTHVTATGQIGMFRIVSESSVAAGIRRIEAITGEEAYRRSLEDREIIESLSETLNAPAPELSERVRQLIEQNKSLEKELQQLRVQSSNVTVDEWIKHAQPIANFSLVVKAVQLNSVDQLKEMGDILRDRLKSGVGVLGMVLDGKINFLCVITDDLIKQKNLKAGDIVKEIAAIAGGSGGGRPHMALAGAKDLSKFELALAEVENIIRKKM
ncbi:MAG: alanine--tRNA ligase, partial [candidate division KSB1 bacterium]|nr:alanine--tRNA ligase [candidate division KSB1 bacterium]